MIKLSRQRRFVFFAFWGGLALSAEFAFAASAPIMPPLQVFHVNPASLREQLLPPPNDPTSGNISLQNTLLQVHDARDQVSMKRAELLPSLNVTAAIKVVSGGPTFLLQAVDILLPFLMPANYFNLYAQKAQFEAEKIAYQIMELNTYSEALAIYYTALADAQSQAYYEKLATDLNSVAQFWQRQEQLQLAPVSAVIQAQADAQQAEINASQNAELVEQETASLRAALGAPLDLNTRIILVPGNVPVSSYELSSPAGAQAAALNGAPEVAQIDDLISAAGDEKWAAIFGFVNSSQLSISTGSGGISNGNIVSGGVNLGFAEFPAVSLASRNIQEIEMQKISLAQSIGETLESAINSIAESKKQLGLAQEAVASYQQIYNTDLNEYNLGLFNYTDLLIARTNLTTAQLSLVRAQLDLNLQRINIHREMRSFEFANIKGCILAQPQKGGFNPIKAIGNLFGSTEGNVTLDQACRENGSAFSSIKTGS
ncbi:MAG: TolC family protein [Oligoflexia bacterium]|nr:TolC family protein [Oligoflexia bacterium]